MEERLTQFIEVGAASAYLGTQDVECAGALHFVHNQVVKLATDCLRQAHDKLLSSAYFYEMSENLQTLLYDVILIFFFFVTQYSYYCYTTLSY